MKRVHILERPTPVDEIDGMIDMDEYGKDWGQKAERVRLRRWRRVKHQAA